MRPQRWNGWIGGALQRAKFSALVVALVVGGWPLAEPNSASAQVGFRNRGDEQALDQILLAPRPLTRLLREGKLAIDEKRYSDGIAALGALLLEEPREDLPDDALHQDFFTEPAGDGYYKTSVRGEALRLLGSIPEEGRKTLEIQYGVAARQALDAAIAARNIDAIVEVTRKYYHTEAGYDASVLLAQDKLIRGFPIAAASILQRLSEFPAARKRFGAQLIGELAAAWVHAGRMDLAAQTLDRGVKLFAGTAIMLGDRQVPLDRPQDWRQLLAEVYPTQSQVEQRSLQNWLMTGGEPARNGMASAGLPLPTINWDMTLHRDRSDEDNVKTLAAREAQAGTVLLPKIEARMMGDIVLAKTATSNIFAIDLATGLRLWPFYKHLAPVELAPRAMMLGMDTEEAFIGTDLKNRIWGSSAFGQFTCDAHQLYYISSPDDQQFSQPAFLNPFSRGMNLVSHNFMTGVSLQGEGKVMWHIGGPDGENEPALAGAYFLGPPLSFEGDLYALAEVNGETRLVVLDARTGQLQWSQQLTQSPMSPISRDSARQAQALSPSISDAVVVCPVGNGAVIAVDLLTRSLLWAKQYQVANIERNQFQPFNSFGEGMESYNPTEERWQEPQLIIHKGQIVFTPVETNMILCMDLLTGVPRWQQARGAARYVAGIHNDQIVMVANTEVYALNLSDGRPSWAADVPLASTLTSSTSPSANTPASGKQRTGRQAGGAAARDRETVAGKSVRDGKFLYVPTSAKRVLQIDLEEGQFVGAVTVDEPLGNLFAFKDRLISVGATKITSYYTRDALSQEVERRLAANPNDAAALNQQSLIYMADKRIQDAIEVLRRSYSINPDDGETRYLLANALLSGLEEDFDGYMALAVELEPIIESQHFRFLVLLAKGNLRAGQNELAFTRLLELMRERLRTKQPSLQARVESMPVSPGHEVDIDTWIATQLAVAFERAEPEQRERMLKMVRDRLAAAGKSHPLTREMELQYLAWLEAAHPALFSMAENLLGNTDQTVGERLMQPVLYSNNAQLRENAEAALAESNQADDAVSTYGADDQYIANDNGQIVPVAPPSPAAPTSVQWPRGMVEAHVSKDDGPVRYGLTRIKQSGTRYGRPAVDVGLANDNLTVSNELGQQISVCDFERGLADGVDHFLRCQVDGGLIILETQTELAAFDMYRGRESSQDACLWRYSLARVPSGPRTPHGAPMMVSLTSPLGFQTHSRGSSSREAIVGPITPAGIVIQKESDVIMLSALTGSQLWRRGGYDDRTILARNGLEIAVVHPSAGKIDVLDCRDGGLLRQLDYNGDWTSWFTSGPHVVQYTKRDSNDTNGGGIRTDSNSGTAIRILDAFTGEVVLEKEFASASRADRCDDRYLIVVEPSGELWYCDVANGKVATHALPPMSRLDRARVQRFGDRLVVLTSVTMPNPAGVQVLPKADEPALSKGLHPVNGPMVGLSAEDGSLLWERPGVLFHFTFPEAQPRRSPYMACYRVVRQNGSSTAHLALVDLRDGTLAYFNTNLSLANSSGEFAMEIAPAHPSVRISIGTYLLTLMMTEDEKPPQPVCFFGALAPVRPKSSGNQEFDLFRPSR